MADTKATALVAGTVLHPTDLLLGVDVTDTTMNASGSTKRYSPAIVTAGLPVFGASGGSHAQGLVPDPGASAGTAKYLREDATWFTPPTGSGGVPGGTGGTIQYNNAGAFGGMANWSLGAGGQITGTPISDPGSPAAGDMWVSSSQRAYSRLNSGCVVRDGGVIWSANSPGTALANSVGPASLFAGIASSVGSLTIPANSLVPGKIIRLRFSGVFSTTASTPTVVFQMYLGSTMVLGGTSGNIPTAQTGGSFVSYGLEAHVQATGATGKVVGMGTVTFCSSIQGGVGTVYFTSGLGSTEAQVTVDTTVALAIDLRATWTAASATNSVQILSAWVEILG